MVKIFFDDNRFNCLKKSIAATFVVGHAVRLNFFGSNAITRNEVEARNLLLYASHCPTVVALINKALLSAGIPVVGLRNENACQNRLGDRDFSVFLLLRPH